MYATHFELNGRPFQTAVAQDTVFIGDPDAHAALLLHARIALSSPDSALLLLGPPGVGKTTLAAQALRASSEHMRTAVAWLRTPPASPHELLELLLAEFGFEPYKQSRAERLHSWRQFLTELAATGTRVFVALERAHDAESTLLQALDALTAADPSGCPGAHLILMGLEELLPRVDNAPLAALRQRVRLVRHVAPLHERGVEAYLRHAVESAGGHVDRIFTPGAVTLLASCSSGIPRMLNHLADSALALAAARGVPIVTAALVAELAADVYGLAAPAADLATEPCAEPAGGIAPAPADIVPEAACAPVLAEAAPRAAGAITQLTEPASLPDNTTSRRAESAAEIPVLTDFIDAHADGGQTPDDDLDSLDPAVTMTLLNDDLDELSTEIAAEILAADRPDTSAELPSDEASKAPADLETKSTRWSVLGLPGRRSAAG
jgi:general secretion pathway protein A